MTSLPTPCLPAAAVTPAEHARGGHADARHAPHTPAGPARAGADRDGGEREATRPRRGLSGIAPASSDRQAPAGVCGGVVDAPRHRRAKAKVDPAVRAIEWEREQLRGPGVFLAIEANSLNERMHHMAKHRHATKARTAACYATKPYLAANPVDPGVPHTVWLIRYGPRKLDDDNCTGALKPFRDGVADALGVKDNDPRFTWNSLWQVQSPPKCYGVRIVVLPTHTTAGGYAVVPPPEGAAHRALLEGADIGGSGGARTRATKGGAI